MKQPDGKGGTLSDKSVRNALGPLTACLATARREGLIPHNPATGAALSHRPRIEDDEDRPRPFPRLEDGTETMELIVQLVHPAHRPMFELLAATGVRRSELIALRACDLHLDGDQPYVQVRQRAVRRTGAGMVVGALKSATPVVTFRSRLIWQTDSGAAPVNGQRTRWRSRVPAAGPTTPTTCTSAL